MPVAKGWIINYNNGSVKHFQFNPRGYSAERSAKYTEDSAPGMSYPDAQFVKGEGSDIPLTLFFFDKPHSGVIPEYVTFLEQFLPPLNNKDFNFAPPVAIIKQGDFIQKGVLKYMKTDVVDFDDLGRPIHATITLTFRRVP